jgi:hypothetical protein
VCSQRASRAEVLQVPRMARVLLYRRLPVVLVIQPRVTTASASDTHIVISGTVMVHQPDHALEVSSLTTSMTLSAIRNDPGPLGRLS